MKNTIRIFSFLFGFGFGASALACSCVPMDRYVEGAFTSTASEIALVLAEDSVDLGDEFQTEFTVVKSFKGSKDRFTATSGKVDSLCGKSFSAKNGLYLVFAYIDQEEIDGGLTTSLCSSSVVSPNNSMVRNTIHKLVELSKNVGEVSDDPIR